jgi:hypothetical protein
MEGVENKSKDIKTSDVFVWPHNYKCSTTTEKTCVSMTSSALKQNDFTRGKRNFTNYRCIFPPSISLTHGIFALKTHKIVFLSSYIRCWIMRFWVQIYVSFSTYLIGLEINRPTLPPTSHFLCIHFAGYASSS